ncbi:MAG: tetratricopeptide repeat protein [Candidatus Binatia bacterium]|nr:tetratricopeptide repeat protein [Candidatus Binatia bacterium]
MLLALVLVAYWPALGGDFVRWDDQFYVFENELLREPSGWKAFWNPTERRTPQFYPLVFSSYWLEYRLWGLDARGYHAVNAALHAANTALAFCLVRQWGFATVTAFSAAAVFALHPVQVASVAWISERKNVLSGFFLLLAFTSYWRAERRRPGWYVASFASFVASLLSKTQGVALPLSFLIAEWAAARCRGRRVAWSFWRDGVLYLLPFFAASAVMALITVHFEHDRWPPLPYTGAERFLIATNALLSYLRTILWPADLSPIYPKWELSTDNLGWWLAPVGLSLALAALWLWRNRVPPWMWWGLVHFCLGLLPVLGIVPFNFFTYAFVADHFLYLSMLGAGVALAVALQAARTWYRTGVRVVALGLAVGLAILSWHEAWHWRDNLSFWLHVRERDPRGFLANFNLGLHFRREGRWEDAARYFRLAAEARPEADFPFRRYAEALRLARGEQAVIEMATAWLGRAPNFAPGYLERGISQERSGEKEQALSDYERARRLAPLGSSVAAEAQQRLLDLRARSGSATGP